VEQTNPIKWYMVGLVNGIVIVYIYMGLWIFNNDIWFWVEVRLTKMI
jgi:hypothetical protein